MIAIHNNIFATTAIENMRIARVVEIAATSAPSVIAVIPSVRSRFSVIADFRSIDLIYLSVFRNGRAATSGYIQRASYP